MEALRHALAEAKAARLQGELVCEQLASFGHSPDAKRSSSSSNRSSTAPWSATASGANLRQELSRTGKTIAASVQSTGIANKVEARMLSNAIVLSSFFLLVDIARSKGNTPAWGWAGRTRAAAAAAAAAAFNCRACHGRKAC
eukprot:SAG31_NODE_928_length_10927_cov_4.616273_4_plen_142_part_00